MRNEELLADIGNSYFHIYDGHRVTHLSYADAIEKYKNKPLHYISVKHQLASEIDTMKQWKNISSLMQLQGGYETMGVDRKALCLSHPNGIFVDAGSAITVDVMENGRYRGGFILPGIRAYLKSYESISKALKTELSQALDLAKLPHTTKEQISYGIIASIKALIDKHADGKTLYFTGGDGAFLARFFDNAIYEETLVFMGMKKALQTSEELGIRN